MTANKYVATLRATYEADSEVDATLIADTIAENGKRDLELDEGDTLEVTQVMSFGNYRQIIPQEALNTLRKSRNILIRTRFKDCYMLAQELDRHIHYLKYQVDPQSSMEAPNYDYGDFLDVAHQVLKLGRDPL